MNDYQHARKNSFDLVVRVCEEHPNTTALVPRFASTFVKFKSIVQKISDHGVVQATNITGITANKNNLINEVIHQLVDVSGAVHSYALLKTDNDLAAKVNYKEWTVERMSINDLLEAATIVLDEATKIAAQDLADEGISADDLAAFKKDVEELTDIKSDTRNSQLDRSNATQQIADLFSEANELKRNTLDRLATQFQRKDPDFFQKYKAASNLIIKRSSKAEATTPA